MPARFDPGTHPALRETGERLRELAGDAAYAAGRDYARTGAVRGAIAAGATAYATVSGSTDYRVTVPLDDAAAKPGCTCPAHRRKPHCKHVVAVVVALLDHPAAVAIGEAIQAPAPPPKARRTRAATGTAAPKRDPNAERTALRGEGLALVDRVLAELAGGGVLALGPDKAALLAQAGELVGALKLRRLGNLIVAVQAAGRNGRDGVPDERRFARLLQDLWLTRQATGAHLEGRVALDPRLGEDLLGKTWRAADLEPVAGLELVQIAADRAIDAEFAIDTGTLVDPASGAVYLEKRIVPSKLRGTAPPLHRLRLLVEEAGLYPGAAPRRIKLVRARRAPLRAADIARVVAATPDRIAGPRRALLAALRDPFGGFSVPVLLRPSALVHRGEALGALDADGEVVPLQWPDGWRTRVPGLLPEPGRYALLGDLVLTDDGICLRCRAVVGDGLRWSKGPTFPELT